MRKCICLVLVVLIIAYAFGLVRDLSVLQNHLIRLHVVGASDHSEDQTLKLQVKDAVVNQLSQALGDAQTTEEALALLETMIPQIRDLAESVIREQGSEESVEIMLGKEAFPKREYDTFSLPAGVYQSLRIRIGDAEGRNWWCVVFPSLCLPSTVEDLRDTAAGAGFSQELNATVTGEPAYEIRFFLLDLLGQIQNLWFRGN